MVWNITSLESVIPPEGIIFFIFSPVVILIILAIIFIFAVFKYGFLNALQIMFYILGIAFLIKWLWGF
ncbi:MAG: hypothetical protein ACOC56_02585 [Atribacterota bacterium]